MKSIYIILMLIFIITFVACEKANKSADNQNNGNSGRVELNQSGTQISETGGSESKATTKAAPVDWTVMVFLNGDNNLEEFAVADFLEMSKIGSSDRVNIIAQFDRTPGWDDSFGDWTQTLRFRITQGMTPDRENALSDYDTEADMGDGKTLGEFVNWTQQAYPANRYMLIIWDHGAGWRFFNELRVGTLQAREADRIDDSLIMKRGSLRSLSQRSLEESPVKSVSHDSTSGRSLYNREVQDNLSQNLNKKLDVVGFDACLMGMVETAYAMRMVADTMVGSEELEPGPGWQHDDWAKALVEHPEMNSQALGNVLVESYKKQYANESGTTLSSINLTRLDPLAASIDNFATALTTQLNSSVELGKIKAARNNCKIYGSKPPGPGAYYNIDLLRFSDLIAKSTGDAALRTAAQQVAQEISQQTVLNFYAHNSRQDGNGFGSHGIAIYFPANKKQFDADALSSAYQDSNNQYPVEFVKTHNWDNFLQEFYKKVP